MHEGVVSLNNRPTSDWSALDQTTICRTASNSRLFRQIECCEKEDFLSLIGLETLWEKEKMLVTSIFSFSQYVFKSHIPFRVV